MDHNELISFDRSFTPSKVNEDSYASRCADIDDFHVNFPNNGDIKMHLIYS